MAKAEITPGEVQTRGWEEGRNGDGGTQEKERLQGEEKAGKRASRVP